MSTAEVIECAQCPFSTLTQKGLTIHLRKMHNVQTHNRKPRRTQNRRQGIRLANCSMSAKSWGLPFVCVICGYRTAEKMVIKEHVARSHMLEEECKHSASPCEASYSGAVVQAGPSTAMDRRANMTVPTTYRPIMNCEDIVVGYSSQPEPAAHMSQQATQYQFSGCSEQTYVIRQLDAVSTSIDDNCSGGRDDDVYDDEDDNE